MELDFDRCYRTIVARDARFDGCFIMAVSTTGIYCRPSCPAVTPKRQNVSFYPSAAAAQRGGYRACLRCRPDAAPGSPDWDVRADVVGRALRLIGDGVVDREGVPGLARRLGYTERHLNRMLTAELGAGPLSLARAQRAQTARTLIENTDLGLAEIAFAAGFGSVRQFNDTVLEVFAATPSALRARRKPASGNGLRLRLPYRAPFDSSSVFDFLTGHAVAGVESAEDGYSRRIRLPHGPGEVKLEPGKGHVTATLTLADLRDLAPAVARCRRLLDLDADPEAVSLVLGADPVLAEAVTAAPGVRMPRTVDGFEATVRAIVGQQVSIASARNVAAKLVRDGLFPDPEALLALPDEAFAMPARRRETLRALASAALAGDIDLDGGSDREAARRALLALPGVGPWTAGYVALRALGDPDVLLDTDLIIRRTAGRLGITDLAAHAERWRPWRSYAMLYLWRLS
ncbi:AlkA N-terminal domain-containing protein [Longispora albida]|uniref:AlkA N-terminal domain-containing protein n=1 Tax=Longispora albida TaxID=203523 RepID=UPI0003761717|nr:AlkA N-terminal domain-containing protein [Longispora albida]